jgi:hypothetical protein
MSDAEGNAPAAGHRGRPQGVPLSAGYAPALLCGLPAQALVEGEPGHGG